MLTIEEAKALTAMLYGAPVSTKEAQALVIAIAMNDHLRSIGRNPLDPANVSRSAQIPIPPHIDRMLDDFIDGNRNRETRGG